MAGLNNMNIYRLEYTNGMGIYHYDKDHDLRKFLTPEEKRPKANSCQPMPQDDALLVSHLMEHFKDESMPTHNIENTIFHQSYFGFDTIEKLFKWFWEKTVLAEIAEQRDDIVVAEYDIPSNSVIIGNTQCLIEPCFHTKSNLIKTWKLKDFLKIYS